MSATLFPRNMRARSFTLPFRTTRCPSSAANDARRPPAPLESTPPLNGAFPAACLNASMRDCAVFRRLRTGTEPARGRPSRSSLSPEEGALALIEGEDPVEGEDSAARVPVGTQEAPRAGLLPSVRSTVCSAAEERGCEEGGRPCAGRRRVEHDKQHPSPLGLRHWFFE